jgi:hypothetical protein
MKSHYVLLYGFVIISLALSVISGVVQGEALDSPVVLPIRVHSVTKDPQGNVYMVGTQGPTSSLKGWLLKRDSNGFIQWIRNVPYSPDNYRHTVLATDASVVVTGYSSATSPFTDIRSGLFILRMNALNGNTEQIIDSDNANSRISSAVLNNGYLYVSGEFTSNSLSITGAATITKSSSNTGIFVLKVNVAYGIISWSKAISNVHSQCVSKLVLNSSASRVFIVGTKLDSATVAVSGMTAGLIRDETGYHDIIIIQLSASDSSFVSAQQISSVGYNNPQNMISSNGYLTLVAQLNNANYKVGTTDVSTFTRTNTNTIIFRFNADDLTSFLPVTSLTTTMEYTMSIQVTSSNKLVISGKTTSGDTTLGGVQLNADVVAIVLDGTTYAVENLQRYGKQQGGASVLINNTVYIGLSYETSGAAIPLLLKLVI